MTRLYLIRHGQTDWNIEGRWQGQADVPLNQHGREQAEKIARELAGEGIKAIYSSDLSRARQTAQAISTTTGLSIHFDPRLREIHQGDWQGMLVSEIQARYGEKFRQRKENPLAVAPPGGETVMQVQGRVVAAVEDIVHGHPVERVAVVSHGFALAVIQMHYLRRPIEDVWEMIPENDEWRELVIGEHSIQ